MFGGRKAYVDRESLKFQPTGFKYKYSGEVGWNFEIYTQFGDDPDRVISFKFLFDEYVPTFDYLKYQYWEKFFEGDATIIIDIPIIIEGNGPTTTTITTTTRAPTTTTGTTTTRTTTTRAPTTTTTTTTTTRTTSTTKNPNGNFNANT